MKSNEILPGQSLLDMALQETGTYETAFTIARQNGLSITDKLLPGSWLKVKSDESNRVVTEYQATSIFPATELRDGLINEGIGYMSIDMDFIVN